MEKSERNFGNVVFLRVHNGVSHHPRIVYKLCKKPEYVEQSYRSYHTTDDNANQFPILFHRGFEKGRIKELAEMFPDLADSLMKIRDNIQDLIDPFHHGHYYTKAIGNSFSIKSVLPAMFPNDPELDYHNLEGVHNGGEAMTLFPLIKDLPPAEQEIARKNLLKYCELDTYAMVKIWQKLKELCG
ncbi:MAG: DUF2779 domain-containing protein [Clostridiales bacterium]|nr:DUF2779 domain-containing protein [Clostridiales bacterium]